MEITHRLFCLLGSVVRGSIKHQYCRLSPLFILLVQDLHQLLKIQLHSLRIRIGLKKANIDLAVVVYRSDHGDPGPHRFSFPGELIALLLPQPPPEVALSYPSLINHNKPSPLF